MTDRTIPPVVTAMLVADQVIVDAATGKKTLVGVYTRMSSPKVPFVARLSIYAQLADASGEYTFRMEVADLNENTVIAAVRFGPVRSPSRLDPMEICMQLPVKLPEYGKYEFRLLLEDGTLVGARTFSLVKATRGSWPSPPSAPGFPPSGPPPAPPPHPGPEEET